MKGLARFVGSFACLLAALAPAPARAAEGEQQFADLGSCTLESGKTIEPCRIGYRTFGKLNANQGNAVLMPTWLYGHSGDLVSLFGDGSSPQHHVDTNRLSASPSIPLGMAFFRPPPTVQRSTDRRFLPSLFVIWWPPSIAL